MLLPAILLTAYGGVALLIGLIFLIPYHYVTTRFDRTTTGQVIDLVKNAAKFNREQGHEEAEIRIGSTPIKVEVSVGGRSRISHNGTARTTSNTYHKVYTYSVNGETYTRADGVRYSKGLAKKWLDKDVSVYYDSADPSRASLSNGKGYKLVCCILIPVGIVLLALAAWFWMQV